MLLKKELLSSTNLNDAYLSKKTTTEQSIASPLRINGVLTLKTGGTVFSDNVNTGYLRIDPQGNHVIIYDGVNNQKLSVLSSDGGKGIFMTALSAENYGLIDMVGATSHIEIGTSGSGRDVVIGKDLITNSIRVKDGIGPIEVFNPIIDLGESQFEVLYDTKKIMYKVVVENDDIGIKEIQITRGTSGKINQVKEVTSTAEVTWVVTRNTYGEITGIDKSVIML